jgi:NodT family efflux transporter outer membrane factor (OMF) lipoprotein
MRTLPGYFFAEQCKFGPTALSVLTLALLSGCSVLGLPTLTEMATPEVTMPSPQFIVDKRINALEENPAALMLTVKSGGVPVLVPAHFSVLRSASSAAEMGPSQDESISSQRLEWWRVFDPSGQGQLSQLHALLLKHNPAFLTAIASLELARSTLSVASAPLFPTVNVALGKQWSSSQGSPAFESTNLGASIGWDLDFLGLQAQRLRSSHLEYKASLNDHAVLRRAQQATLNQAYFTWLFAHQQARFIEQTLPVQEALHQVNEVRYQERMISLQELLASRVQFQNLSQQRYTLVQQARQADAAIAALLGQSPAVFRMRLPEVSGQLVLPLPKVPQLPSTLPASVIQNRPDIENAAMRVQQAHMNIGAARMSLFPVGLQLSANRATNGMNLQDFLSSSAAYGWGLSLNGALALFDGGTRRHAVKASEVAAEQSKLHYQQTVLQAVQEVENGLSELEQINRQLTLQTDSIAYAKKTYEIAKMQYEERYLAKVAWLSAQLNYLTTDQQQFAMQIQQLQTMNQLLKNVADW